MLPSGSRGYHTLPREKDVEKRPSAHSAPAALSRCSLGMILMLGQGRSRRVSRLWDPAGFFKAWECGKKPSPSDSAICKVREVINLSFMDSGIVGCPRLRAGTGLSRSRMCQPRCELGLSWHMCQPHWESWIYPSTAHVPAPPAAGPVLNPHTPVPQVWVLFGHRPPCAHHGRAVWHVPH